MMIGLWNSPRHWKEGVQGEEETGNQRKGNQKGTLTSGAVPIGLFRSGMSDASLVQ